MRMYILIKEDISAGYAALAAAHGSLAAYMRFRGSPEVSEWISGTFHKVICSVNESEFKGAKDCPDNIVITESALGGIEVAIAFKPREEYPKHFRFYRMYK